MNKKQLMEMLNDAKEGMENILDAAKSENRAFTAEETAKFDEFEAEAGRIQKTIDAMNSVDKFKNVNIVTPEPKMTQEERDVKNFADLIRSSVNGEPMQQDSNITKGDNGAIIPTTIANKIIEAVKDISPIFARAQHYNVKGKLLIPKVDDDDNGIAMAYANEFTDLESVSAKFTSVELTGYLAGILVKVSKSLINNTDINLTNEVVRLMANAVAEFYEKETLIGTSGKSEGISTATQVVDAASATAVTVDELIGVQDSLKSAYQRNACWIVNPSTLTAIRKLKYSGTGEYVLNPDLRQGYGTTLLGKPVFTSDQMPELTTGNKAIVYADFSQALAVKLVEQFELEVLKEKYATQHALGFVGWTEFDSKIQNNQAISVLKMA